MCFVKILVMEKEIIFLFEREMKVQLKNKSFPSALYIFARFLSSKILNGLSYNTPSLSKKQEN